METAIIVIFGAVITLVVFYLCKKLIANLRKPKGPDLPYTYVKWGPNVDYVRSHGYG